jgi:superfamily II DNA/RNA helicase
LLFTDFPLDERLLKAVDALGFSQPTPVQQASLQASTGEASTRPDLLVSSQTGSGKTVAFLLPMIQAILEAQADQDAGSAEGGKAGGKKGWAQSRDRRWVMPKPVAVVLCPTRELALQVARDAIGLVKFCRGVRISTVIGGTPYRAQMESLQGATLVVATPGRLLDLARNSQLGLDDVRCLTLDEADRMLDLGFAEDLAAIHELTQKRQQTWMFSATLAPRIQQLAKRVMRDHGAHVQSIEMAATAEPHADIRQVLHWCDDAQHKRALLDHWMRDSTIDQAIIFVNTQVECDQIADEVRAHGFYASALHGAMNQSVRNRRLASLREGHIQFLVATDVAARGIDVPTITHVFNFGLPMKAEDYTHRIGRTGRAGRSGTAVTFAEGRDRRRLFDIEHHQQQKIPAETIAGLEPKQAMPFPTKKPGRKPGYKPGSGHNKSGYKARTGNHTGHTVHPGRGQGPKPFSERRQGPKSRG